MKKYIYFFLPEFILSTAPYNDIVEIHHFFWILVNYFALLMEVDFERLTCSYMHEVKLVEDIDQLKCHLLCSLLSSHMALLLVSLIILQPFPHYATWNSTLKTFSQDFCALSFPHCEATKVTAVKVTHESKFFFNQWLMNSQITEFEILNFLQILIYSKVLLLGYNGSKLELCKEFSILIKQSIYFIEIH